MTAAAARPAAASPVRRLAVRLTGAVQGVGMRPHIHGLAARLGLSGHVLNGPDGVAVEVEGACVDDFVALIAAEPPPLARIERIEVRAVAATGERGFAILPSRQGAAATRIPADAATCPACLCDLRDPSSRFFGYPFVNCTHCGPRYTITRRLPYDRATTAMAGFAMCEACAGDYADPADRRFHAEPIACPACGPRLSHPVADIAATIRAGRIVALKGIGGFHLLCDARAEAVVAELRRRKGRDAKPFAVMVADTDGFDVVARPTDMERRLASTPARPVVLAALRPGVLARSVAPGLSRIGVMLAYAPVHHLLFDALRPEPGEPTPVLVATSANPGGEPLVFDDADAARRLDGIADLVVGHDRPIVVRADDSVMQVIAGAPAVLRRARGLVPDPVVLADDGPPVLALGAHLKATVTVTRGREAFVSQHIGDLDTAETVRFWRESVDHLLALTGVDPDRVVCDLHPDYRSSLLADSFGRPVVRVQHHAAHVAAVAAEHGLAGPVLGLALDGHGLGNDGGAWGGEAIVVDGASHRRIGGLAPMALPGGDRAAREPWRMAAAVLADLGRIDEIARRFAGQPQALALAARLATGAAMPSTSSCGRLFDAAAALSGLRPVQSFEGQAAMEFEALVDTPRVLAGGYRLAGGLLDLSPLLAVLATGGLSQGEAADLFHGTLAKGLAALAAEAAAPGGHETVVLGGGCLMNRVLAEALVEALAARGLAALLPVHLPPNDGGLSLGQAVLARAATRTPE